MNHDGQDDFHTITRLEPRPDIPAAGIVVLSNSSLIASMISAGSPEGQLFALDDRRV